MSIDENVDVNEYLETIVEILCPDIYLYINQLEKNNIGKNDWEKIRSKTLNQLKRLKIVSVMYHELLDLADRSAPEQEEINELKGETPPYTFQVFMDGFEQTDQYANTIMPAIRALAGFDDNFAGTFRDIPVWTNSSDLDDRFEILHTLYTNLIYEIRDWPEKAK